MKIFLAPHNDDEALFGAYTILREKPLVVIVTDSYIQKKRLGIKTGTRIAESEKAMEILGADIEFLHIPDDLAENDFTGLVRGKFNVIKESADMVYAPAIQGGHWQHDVIGQVAKQVWGSKVIFYSTYSKEKLFVEDGVKVIPSEEEMELKNKALDCYVSEHSIDGERFELVRNKPEYIFYSQERVDAGKNLLELKELMEEAKIPFCLMDGTCLGAYREKDFIKGDEGDIDIAIPSKDYDRFLDILPKLIDKGFRKVKPHFIVNNQVEGCAYERGLNHIDFERMNIKDGKAFNLARRSSGMVAYVYPSSCFETFDKIEFLGKTFNIPHNTEKFLSLRYIDWKKPVDVQKYRENSEYLEPRFTPCLKEYDSQQEKIIY